MPDVIHETTKICAVCGREFVTEKIARRYCDKCWIVNRVCQVCGKDFSLKRWRLLEREPKFCSIECANKGKTVPEAKKLETLVCQHCGATFKAWPSEHRRFCSRDCADKAAVGERRSPETEFRKGNTPWFIENQELNPAKRPEVRRKKSRITANLWKDDDYVGKQIKSRGVRPNKAEQNFEQLMIEQGLPFRYVGDGKLIIEGKCPDFANSNGVKQLVELFGDYWHTSEEAKTRKEIFSKYGFDTLIIWYSELKSNPDDVLERVASFCGV